MKNQYYVILIGCFFALTTPLASQEIAEDTKNKKPNLIFRSEKPLEVVLKYSNKELLKNTDDSTYLTTDLSYLEADGEWKSLEVKLRARGNWRRKHCFLAPVKMKIKKSQRRKTEFKGNKELKIVLPCRNNDNGHDYILKEYIAYKMYELVSPYHFKTRRMQIHYTDVRKKKDKNYDVLGFAIEDMGELTHRLNSKKIKSQRHPLTHNSIASIQNDLFQFMIGNLDFSSYFQHNEKLIQVDNKGIVPVPYDFDMSGLVNASYAQVSMIEGEKIEITDVTQRLYRGYLRDEVLYQQVRQDYLRKKQEFLAILESHKSDFWVEQAYDEAEAFLLDFFEILSDDSSFDKEILQKARQLDN